ncbi:MAG: LPS export ABC transporter periplasmic protein LptC [Bacteroidales bacterium]|nr:LPS export ABC transporter periplasmic protein LptC [Bacteroidales bacterium]
MSHSLISGILSQIRNGALALFLICCIVACSNDPDKIKQFERQTLPQNTLRNADMQRSEDGKLRMVLKAPLIEQYNQPESKTEYPKGLYVKFFNGYQHPTATLKARYAVTYDTRNKMFAKDSVVIIDLQRGDTVYLQDLTWDRNQHRIFTEKPVRSKNGQRVTYGDSFESDDEFNSPLIVHQRGTIEWNDEE